jgi:uncharacterized protein YecT (DUF1311 family)
MIFKGGFKMNKIPKSLMVMITVVVILAACQSSSEQSTANSQEPEGNTENQEQNEAANKAVNEEEKSDDNQTVAENEENQSEPEATIQITSGEDAIQYLKQHIKEGTDDNVSFGATESPASDDNGSYYTVRLVDISLRLAGKTGTLDTYKVYQDGTYELFQLEPANSDSAKEHKEEYIKKLNDIKKEMEELQKNSEAATTVDMEEEEAYRYKRWDAELNEIYGVLEEHLNKEQMEKLREEQRNWIKYRDETAKEASQKYKGGSMEAVEYVAAQATLTRERCYELVAKYMK